MLVAGPLGGDGGLVVLRFTDQAAAHQIMADDPAVMAGVFVVEAHQFVPRIGGAVPLVPPDGG